MGNPGHWTSVLWVAFDPSFKFGAFWVEVEVREHKIGVNFKLWMGITKSLRTISIKSSGLCMASLILFSWSCSMRTCYVGPQFLTTEEQIHVLKILPPWPILGFYSQCSLFGI